MWSEKSPIKEQAQQIWLNQLLYFVKKSYQMSKQQKQPAFNRKMTNKTVIASALCGPIKKIHRGNKTMKKPTAEVLLFWVKPPIQQCIPIAATWHMANPFALKNSDKRSRSRRGSNSSSRSRQVPVCGRCQACNMLLICLEVVSSFKCLVVYLLVKHNRKPFEKDIWCTCSQNSL